MGHKADIRWLALGALAGLVVAGYGILRQSTVDTELPKTVVARVNTTMIDQDVFDQTLQSIGVSERTQENKILLLQRLVDNELLVQRGVELGMTGSDPEVRNAIVNSLVASITAEADAANPTEEELKKYLAENAENFSYTSKIWVDVWQSDMEQVAQKLVRILQAGGIVPEIDGIEVLADLPDALTETSTLREHLGPAITSAVVDMPEGSSAIFARRGRWLVVKMVSKERNYVTDLSTIRSRVLLSYRRNLANKMLTSYIDSLRQRADIQVTTP